MRVIQKQAGVRYHWPWYRQFAWQMARLGFRLYPKGWLVLTEDRLFFTRSETGDYERVICDIPLRDIEHIQSGHIGNLERLFVYRRVNGRRVREYFQAYVQTVLTGRIEGETFIPWERAISEAVRQAQARA